MSISSNGRPPSDEEINFLQTELDDEALAQLDALLDRMVLSMTLWTESLATVLEEDLSPEERRMLESAVDVDFYFEENLLLELYNAMIYESEDEPYVSGIDRIAEVLTQAVEQGIRLVEIAEEAESGAPIFIFEDQEGEHQVLVVSDAWMVDTWEALPDEE